MTVLLWVHSKELPSMRLQEPHLRRLREGLPQARIVHCTSRQEFLDALPAAEVVSSWLMKQEWLELAPRLRRIISPAAGREHQPARLPAGVTIESCTFHGKIMAETSVAMMLCHARGLLRSDRMQKAGLPWPRAALDPHLRLLHGAHVVVVGFGHVGGHVGRLAAACGARITGLRRTPGPPPEYFGPADRVLPVSELDAVLPEADHLVLCLPGGLATDRVLDARRLALLPAHASICNLGRGNAIDEAALATLLRDRPETEAYLDVFAQEPLPEHSPLRGLPNCLILPHVSANAPQFMDLFVDELIARLTG